jgi:peptidoglycan/LPS O-acetylase OafA/YrhL
MGWCNMSKDRLKRLAVAFGIGVVIGAFSWYLINLTSPCTIASAITGGIIGTLMAMLIMSNVRENTTDSEKDWFALAGIGITTLAFGTAVILNYIANSLFPNAALSGWSGALTCSTVGAITMVAALFMTRLIEKGIDHFYPEKEQPNSLSEVRVEAINLSPINQC